MFTIFFAKIVVVLFNCGRIPWSGNRR